MTGQLEHQLSLAEPHLAAAALAIHEDASARAKAKAGGSVPGQGTLTAAPTAAAPGRPGGDSSPARKKRKKLTQSHFTGRAV